MAEFADAKTAVKNRLANITELQLHDYRPDSITAPAAVVQPSPGILVQFDTSTDSDDYSIIITVYVSRSVDDAAQSALDAYLARSGSKSIRAAVNCEGVANTDYMVVTDARNFREETVGTETYYAVDLPVQIGV